MNNFTISYSGILIAITESVYKQFAFIPGLIRYTFHLPAKKVTIQRAYNPLNGNLCWQEVNKGTTALSKQLGEAYEKSGQRSNNMIIDIELTSHGTLKVNNSVQYKYTDAAYLWN